MRLISTLLAFFIVCATLSAQLDRIYRNYTSTTYTAQQTALGLQDLSFHRTINSLLPRIDNSSEWDEVTVPVVFHVLYADPADRISEEQIAEQIDALNRDFAGLAEPPERDLRDPEGDFAAVKADTKIRFCIPEQGLLDGLLSLINFRQVASLVFDDLNLIKTEGFGIAPLNPQKYLNIWVVPLPDGNSGFAQIPGGNGETDGIVIDPKFFGTSGTATAPYDQGKTLTHLIGSYLGLTPIWGDGSSCGDDGISDTPVHNGPNFGTPGRGHVSTCPGNPAEMTMNFMDATDDALLHMFTREQGAFMRAVLSGDGPRGQLINTATRCSDGKSLAVPTTSPLTSSYDLPATIKTFPNPASTVFTVQLSGGGKEAFIDNIKVYSLKGVIVMEKSGIGKSNQVKLNATDWPRSVYLVKTSLGDGESLVHRITLQ